MLLIARREVVLDVNVFSDGTSLANTTSDAFPASVYHQKTFFLFFAAQFVSTACNV